jgi:MFS transporter, SP family, galactose:H+ symporter
MKYFIASLGGFQFGYSIGIMAGAILFLAPDFGLSAQMEGIVVSSFLMGALPGAGLAGPISNHIGRRRAQQLIALLFLLGSVMIFAASSIPVIVIGRILQGLASGAIAVVGPMYLAEISPRDKRGHFVGYYQLSVTLGILIAYGLNLLLAPHWPLMFLLGAIPALIHLIGFQYLPDSIPKSEHSTTWKGMPLKMLFIAVFLNVFQQITGINAIIYFAPSIFLGAGFDTPTLALFPPILVGITNFALTYVALHLLDRVGRRPLLLIGIAGMAISLCTLVFAYLSDITTMKWIATSSILVYIASFAIGMGPIPSLVSAEIFPQKYRGHAVSIATFSNWIFNFLVVFTFLDFTNRFSHAAIFGLYAIFAFIAFFFTWKYVPETKGVAID